MRSLGRCSVPLLAVTLLPYCGGSGSSYRWGSCDGVDCTDDQQLLWPDNTHLGHALELTVGQTLSVRVGRAMCGCPEQVAQVEWRASAPGIVTFIPDGRDSTIVTAVAPGQVTITAAITFTNGRTQVAIRRGDNWTSPFSITVVDAEG